MDDVLAGLEAHAPAPAPEAHPAKAWASSADDPTKKIGSLLPGEVEGTSRHPFPVVDRAEYLAMIQGFGSIAARTHGAPIALIDISDLTAIQSTVNRERLVAHLQDPRMNDGKRASGHGGLIDRPVVVKVGGRFFVHDGTHRTLAAHLRGQTSIKARLVDLDGDIVRA